MLYLGFNQSSNYFYSNTLRAGVTYAVDRETILSEDYGGFGSIATLPCSPLSAYYDAGLASSYAYSPDSFQYSLSTSGILPDASQPVRLLVSNTSAKRIAVANRIASKLTELGLYTEVTSSSEDEFLYALQTGNFDLYLSEIRLAPNFDLRCFFTLYGSAAYGGIGGDAALQYCDQALENSGNYYDLCRTVVGRGLICPILFRSNALYSARGVVSAHSVSLSNFFAAQPEQSLTDILSETPYQPSAPVTEEDGNTPADGDDTTPTEGDTPEPTGDLPADPLPEDSSAPDGEAPIE